MPEPLVLVPAMGTDGALWRHQRDCLGSSRPVRVHELTLRGSLTGQAQDLLDAAPERFALAGLSLGGMVAMEVLRLAPDRVSRVALLDTNPRAPTDAQYAAWTALAASAQAAGVRETVRTTLLGALLSDARRDELADDVLDMAERLGTERFLAQLDVQASRQDMRPALAAVGCPALVATGADDALCPPAMHEELAGVIPGARLVVVEDCGHLSALERPKAVTQLLEDWLEWAA